MVGCEVTEGGRPVRQGWAGHWIYAKYMGKLLDDFEHIINMILFMFCKRQNKTNMSSMKNRL